MMTAARHLVDELLVMRCQDGEAEAMAELARRWQRPFWRHAYHLTGQVDAAWEAVQEAWLAIVRGIWRLDDPARFRPWAYRIVTNKAADWIARHRRHRRTNQELGHQPQARGADSPDDAASEVLAALSRLPAHQKALLSLRYLDELGVAEIAEILRVPPGTVKSRLHKARKELKRLWERMQS